MGSKCSTKKIRGGGNCTSNGTGNSSSTSMYGGYKYDRKASLASRKRLQGRLSRRKTKKKKKKKKKRNKRRKRTRRRKY